jgi:hypothetical protein
MSDFQLFLGDDDRFILRVLGVEDQSRRSDISGVLACSRYDLKPIYGVNVPRKAGFSAAACPHFLPLYSSVIFGRHRAS